MQKTYWIVCLIQCWRITMIDWQKWKLLHWQKYLVPGQVISFHTRNVNFSRYGSHTQTLLYNYDQMHCNCQWTTPFPRKVDVLKEIFHLLFLANLRRDMGCCLSLSRPLTHPKVTYSPRSFTTCSVYIWSRQSLSHWFAINNLCTDLFHPQMVETT